MRNFHRGDTFSYKSNAYVFLTSFQIWITILDTIKYPLQDLYNNPRYTTEGTEPSCSGLTGAQTRRSTRL